MDYEGYIDGIQFDDYFLYENRLVVDGAVADYEEFEAVMNTENIEYIRIQDKLKLYREKGGNWSGAHVVAVSDTEKLKDFMVLEDPDTGKLLEVPKEGMLVSIRCAENHDLQKGSVLEIMGTDGNPKNIEVSGVIEHYLGYNLFVVSDSYYENIMGEEADESVFLLKGKVEGLYDKVKGIQGFLSLRDNSDYAGMGDALAMIVMICFVFAAIMAVLVMLNQNVMYINRKAKELSVMRINGFTMKETKAFVREVAEVCEFYVDEENNAKSNIIYRKTPGGQVYMANPSKYLIDYLDAQGVLVPKDFIVKDDNREEINVYTQTKQNIGDEILDL